MSATATPLSAFLGQPVSLNRTASMMAQKYRLARWFRITIRCRYRVTHTRHEQVFRIISSLAPAEPARGAGILWAIWHTPKDLNLQPADLEAVALPIELGIFNWWML